MRQHDAPSALGPSGGLLLQFNEPPLQFGELLLQFDGPLLQFNEPSLQFNGLLLQFNGPPLQFDRPLQQFNGSLLQFNEPSLQFNGPLQQFNVPSAAIRQTVGPGAATQGVVEPALEPGRTQLEAEISAKD